MSRKKNVFSKLKCKCKSIIRHSNGNEIAQNLITQKKMLQSIHTFLLKHAMRTKIKTLALVDVFLSKKQRQRNNKKSTIQIFFV